jgi:hypothetical protein
MGTLGMSPARIPPILRLKYFAYCRKSQDDEGRQILSIPAQRDEVQRLLLKHDGIELVHVFEEARTAKAPGRPVFNDMMTRIERGEADGIIAWHPDRLARNSVDGGQLIYQLDRGVLKDLKFGTYTASEWLEPFHTLISFSNLAVFWFDNANLEEKRLILNSVGSNLTLAGKKLSIQAIEPLNNIPKIHSILELCTVEHDVRTFSKDREFKRRLVCMRMLMRQMKGRKKLRPTNDNEMRKAA